MTKQANTAVKRPPVVSVVGHIDHGKSTLLDYIRRSNTTEGEAGGITQHISAYEVQHTTQAGEERKITFLDTPGHEAFKSQRSRGVNIADLAILIVAADDGVQEQTKEAIQTLKQSGAPFVVAINKIDKEGADPERVINELMENEVFLEGYGGQVSYVNISAKTGKGISDLLEVITLAADLEELHGYPEKKAEGVVLESNVDPKKGIAATIIIKDGTLEKGMCVVSGKSYSPVRIMEDFTGTDINEATFSSPVRIIGFNDIPKVGEPFQSYGKKKEAEKIAKEFEQQTTSPSCGATPLTTEERTIIPVIIKADVTGSLDAIEEQLNKMSTEDVEVRIIQKGIGGISESDVHTAEGIENSIIVGFNTKINSKARDIANEKGVGMQTFNIIYELIEWVSEIIEQRRPIKEIEETTGKVKTKKVFTKNKDGQVLGGMVREGYIEKEEEVKILRRDLDLGRGVITNLQQQKVDTNTVEAENECGLQVRSKVDISPGDVLEGFKRSQK